MLASWRKELRSTLFWRCVIAELLASTLYCFFATTMMFAVHQGLGSSTTIQNQASNTALALGFLVMVLSHGFGIVHNAFVFPSITFGKCLMKKASLFKSIFYFASQMIGGIIGVSLDLALNSRRLKDGEIFPRLNVSTGSGCIIEGILTILFVLAFLSTHEKENGRYQVTPSLVFGFGVAASFLIGFQKTGAVLNPAIVFGVGIVHNHWPQFVWIFWVGPLAGGMLGGLLYNLLLFPPNEKELSHHNKQEESENKSYTSNSSASEASSRITKKLDLFEKSVTTSVPAKNYIVKDSMNSSLRHHTSLSSHTFQNPAFENESVQKT